MSDIRPFLSATVVPTRSFAAALPVHAMPAATSPWTPQPVAIVAQTTAVDEAALEAARLAAVAAGRETGLAETTALRTRLATLIAGVEAARIGQATKLADLVADAAIAVIGAWLDRGIPERRELFAPIVRGWLQRTGDGSGAIARVHPDDVAAMRAAVGDALIVVEADAKVLPGDVRICGTDLEITHQWQDRLGELRDAIAAAAEANEIAPRVVAPAVSEDAPEIEVAPDATAATGGVP